MKVDNISESKSMKDHKCQEIPRLEAPWTWRPLHKTLCARFLHCIILTAITCLVLFVVIKFMQDYGVEDKATGVQSGMKRVEAQFIILTNEMCKTEKMVAHIVQDVARIADEFTRSAKQKAKRQKQPAPANVPHVTFEKFKLIGTKDPLQALIQLLSKNELNKAIIDLDLDNELEQKHNKTKKTAVKEFKWSQMKHPLLSVLRLLPKDQLDKRVIHLQHDLEQEQNKTMEKNESLTYPRRIRRAANPDDSQQIDDFWYHYAGDASTSCKVPKQGLKTAEIRCKIWPQSISCNIYCVYGSAFPEGIQRTMNCSFLKNRWSDYFEECQPFVNCKVRLIGPGSLKCVDNQVNKSPSCDIGCEEYEDHDATQPRTYDCKADGTWSPPLPPCVAKKSGIDLVRAPHVLEHKNIDYPQR